MAGLNPLAAIMIYWNTDQLGKAVAQRKREGLDYVPLIYPGGEHQLERYSTRTGTLRG